MLLRWTLLLRRLALLIGCYTILRGLFLICNYRIFKATPANQLALAFVYGLRFDLSAILAINAPFIVFTFLPRVLDPPPGYQRFVKWLFLGLNLPFLALNILDLEFRRRARDGKGS